MHPSDQEPRREISIGQSRITLLGTAHVSRTSAETVKHLLESGEYDAVAVELCPSRYNALINPDDLAKMDLLKVVREGRVIMVMASLAPWGPTSSAWRSSSVSNRAPSNARRSVSPRSPTDR